MESPHDEELTTSPDGDVLDEIANSTQPKNEDTCIHGYKRCKDEKAKKRDDKNGDLLLKNLDIFETTEEKLAAVLKKYTDMFDENRKVIMHLKHYERKCVALQRERDQLQSEQSKAILVRGRLENLCRELQKQNKAIKDESLAKIKEEEEKRKVVSAKFQTALAEITALMQQNNENFSNLKEENLEIQNKFKTLCEQYELKEQQVEKMSKQMQLEAQLADVKLAKLKIDMYAEKEALTNEKEQLLVELTAYQNKCQEMQQTEAALKSQITMYTEKYDEFQNALAKSHQIYSGFKSEIEKMSKKIGRLEKETSIWKMKWEGSHKSLLQMATEKQQRDAELALATRQLNQLQKLCRTLQSERTALINQLKNEGKTPKIGDTNLESTSLDFPGADESQTPDAEENTDSISSQKTENEEVPKCTTNSVDEETAHEMKEIEKEVELELVKDDLDEAASVENCSTEKNDESTGHTTDNELTEEYEKELSDEPKENENANAALQLDETENDQENNDDEDSVKSPANTDPKMGKDGSKK